MSITLRTTAVLALLGSAALGGARAEQSPSTPAAAIPDAMPLDFRELVSAAAPLGPSDRARALAGRRVRMVGFMADMEEPPRGAFFLAGHPVRCDEGGAGTGDLPLDVVRVEILPAAGGLVPYYAGIVEISGTLAVGPTVDEDGRPSFFRVAVHDRDDVRILVRRATSAAP